VLKNSDACFVPKYKDILPVVCFFKSKSYLRRLHTSFYFSKTGPATPTFSPGTQCDYFAFFCFISSAHFLRCKFKVLCVVFIACSFIFIHPSRIFPGPHLILSNSLTPPSSQFRAASAPPRTDTVVPFRLKSLSVPIHGLQPAWCGGHLPSPQWGSNPPITSAECRWVGT